MLGKQECMLTESMETTPVTEAAGWLLACFGATLFSIGFLLFLMFAKEKIRPIEVPLFILSDIWFAVRMIFIAITDWRKTWRYSLLLTIGAALVATGYIVLRK